ncbi:MAG: hypothetical protein QXL01_00265 [Thermoplasmatales archaeon]
MINNTFRENLIKQASELSDELPLIRDRIEDIITVDNIVYVDNLIDKTYYLEKILDNTLGVLCDKGPIKHNDLTAISHDLDLLGKFIETLTDTSIFLAEAKKSDS